MSPDLAASVRARLLNRAKAENSDFNGVLVRYALERLLYRLGQSAHADRFVLKGAMLFALWYGMPTFQPPYCAPTRCTPSSPKSSTPLPCWV